MLSSGISQFCSNTLTVPPLLIFVFETASRWVMVFQWNSYLQAPMLEKYHKMLCLSPLLLLDEVEKLSQSFRQTVWNPSIGREDLMWSKLHQVILKIPSSALWNLHSSHYFIAKFGMAVPDSGVSVMTIGEVVSRKLLVIPLWAMLAAQKLSGWIIKM